MSLLTTTAPPLDVMILNKIPPTYNKHLRQRMKTLLKVSNDVDNVKNYALKLVEREYPSHVHIQVIGPTPITPVYDSISIVYFIFIAKTKAPAVSVSAPSQVELSMINDDNLPPSFASPPSSTSLPSFIEDSAGSIANRSLLEENSIAVSFLETMKSTQVAQTNYM